MTSFFTALKSCTKIFA